MSNKTPFVSVIMPVYNDYLFLDDAISSILNQTYQNFELIICNDGSTDHRTNEILTKWSSQDARIRLINNENNSGISFTLNKLIKNSKGLYIARMDADDISLPNRLERELQFLEDNPDVSFVSCNANIINENSTLSGIITHKEHPTFRDVVEKNCFIHPATMFRVEVFGPFTVYEENQTAHIGRCEDYIMWCSLFEHGFVGANISDTLFQYRESSDNIKKRTRISNKYKYLVKKDLYKKYKDVKPRKRFLIISFLKTLLPGSIVSKIHFKTSKTK